MQQWRKATQPCFFSTHFTGEPVRSKLLFLLCLALVSCGQKADKKHESNTSQEEITDPTDNTSPQPETSRPEAPSTENEIQPVSPTNSQESSSDEDINNDSTSEETTLLDELLAIKDAINNGLLDRREGLEKIAKLIELNKDLERVQKEEEFKDIARVIQSVSGETHENIIFLLGLQKTINSEALVTGGLNYIFMQLEMQHSKISTGVDRVVLAYLGITKNQILASNNEYDSLDAVKDYYFNKIHNLIANEEITATEVIKKYAQIYDVLNEKDVFEIFEKYICEIKINNKMSITANKLYAALLNKLIYKKLPIIFDENLFESAQESALWGLKFYKEHPEELKLALQVTSNYFSLFDKTVLKTSKNLKEEKENWINEIDERSENVAASLMSLFKNINLVDLENIKIHPYLKLYINKAKFQDSVNNDTIFFEDVSNSLNDFVKEFQYQRVQYNPSIEDRALKNEHQQYLNDYYHVEIKRHYLELKSRSHKLIDQNTSKEYDSLLSSLLSALNYRTSNGKTYTLEDLRSKSKKLDLFQGLSQESANQHDRTFSTNYCPSTRSCKTKVFKAGIYVVPFNDISKINIQLFANKMIFTPLAMIYAPGSNVTINANELQNAWIDTSGLNGMQDGYLDKDRKVIYPKGAYKKDGVKEIWSIETKGLSPQNQPQKPTSIMNGQHAGKIALNFNYDGKLSGAPLLVSRGGHGANGRKGLTAIPVGQGSKCQNPITIINVNEKWKSKEKYIKCERNSLGVLECKKKTRTVTHDTRKPIKLLTNQSIGGAGGNGGNSQTPQIISAESKIYHLLKVSVLSPGSGGIAGSNGDCGFNQNKKASKGKDGKIAN